jgi:MinD-like ATPase involved in chromosome partitioning or flagellar assembly
MLSLALLTRNSMAAQAIEQIVHETDLFRLTAKINPSTPVQEALRTLATSGPELILADLADWELIAPLRKASRETQLRARWIGFAPDWSESHQFDLAKAGITQLVREPFGPADLVHAAYTAFHDGETPARPGLWAFLPSKAGGGCSTLVLNTAGALQQQVHRDVLVIEADARSGSISILMDLAPQRPIQEALECAAEMTALEWQKFQVSLGGVHVLPANPSKPGRLPSWADYYHLLRFLDNRYHHILVDLPEVVNDATGEVVRRAENVFVVCTPEIPSLKMSNIRCQDLIQRGVPRERIRLLVTRFKRDEVSIRDVEKNLGWPVYATLANDYRSVRSSILESRLVSSDSPFGKDCRTLAQMLSGAAEAQTPVGALGRLSRLIAK